MNMESPSSTSTAQQVCLRRAERPPRLSVVVKCYNEANRIAACLESILAATRGLDAEVILADALSTDGTIEIAKRYPVRIVQMTRAADRGCGATAQMGQQFARGEFLLVVDSDMELLADFLPVALAEMERNPKLAGVSGNLIEMSSALEFQERLKREGAGTKAGFAKRLSGSALYRMAAIRDVGYFMNRNLYCAEELELGLRLNARGWRLLYIPVKSVRHYGYELPPTALIRQRWKSRYFDGYGQLLRQSWGQPYFRATLRVCWLYLLVVGWWTVLAALICTIMLGFSSPVLVVAIAVLPLAAIGVRKRNFGRALYTALLWQVQAASLLRGLFRPVRDPSEPVKTVVLAD